MYYTIAPRNVKEKRGVQGECEGGGFSERSPSLALPPEEQWAFGEVRSVGSFRLKVGAVFCCLGVVTAADRAAATLRRGGVNSSARFAGTSPFRGGFAGSAAKRLPPQRELSAVRLTEDKPFCWGLLLPWRVGILHHPLLRMVSLLCGRRQVVAAEPPQVSVSPLRRRGGGFPIAPATPSGPHL